MLLALVYEKYRHLHNDTRSARYQYIDIYIQSPTDATVLDSFMGISVLVLLGSLVSFSYIQAVHMGKG